MFLLTLLLVESVISSANLESGFGALFRCFRLALFVGTLWLLSRWWNGGLTFVRYHIRMYFAVLGSVATGLVVSPGAARARPLRRTPRRRVVAAHPAADRAVRSGDHRAHRAARPGPPDRQGQRRGGHRAVLRAARADPYARTATLGLFIGLALAIGSLILTSAAARRFFTWAVLCAVVAAVGFASALQAWFLRGQSKENFSNLTGRAKVWDALLAAPRSTSEKLFGVGLGDKSFGGLPIDNSWLAVSTSRV